MLPYIVYKQIWKDIIYAFINREFTTEQFKENLKAVKVEFKKYYGKDTDIFKD